MTRVQKQILIVDNSTSLLALYQAQIEALGESVRTFRSGAEAIEFAQAGSARLIIIGAELEDTNCLELLSRCRCQHFCTEIPFIVIASSDSSDFRKQCFELGVADFIPRQASQEYLLEHIRLVLDRLESPQATTFEPQSSVHVLIADDSAPIRALYSRLLNEMGAQVQLCVDGQEALEHLTQHPGEIDILITDLEMPRISGGELVRLLRADRRFDTLPIIVVSHLETLETTLELLHTGATDYINKPFRPQELQARLATHLNHSRLLKQQKVLTQQLSELNDTLEQKVTQRTSELNDANNEMMLKLALVCDFKDEDTGNHINRVRLYCEELARAAGFAEEELEHFGYSSMLHDVGKIGVPDDILKKPGPLNEEEWVIMRGHTTKGANLLGEREFFRIAREIAQSHHERMDGTGYPEGLIGSQIPLSARIAAVVDVFDALTSKRCYKEAWSIDEALAELRHMTAGHLDPDLVRKMEKLQREGQLDYIRERYP